MRQRELEIILSRVPRHPEPIPSLEQYTTPSRVAADVLYRALGHGHMAGRRVLDLGCGTGIFAIGAALLGAESVRAVDIDARAVEVARRAAQEIGTPIEFDVRPVDDVEGSFDTVVMNPPFGAQFAARGADVRFLTAAVRLASVGYSLHAHETRGYLLSALERLGTFARVETEYELALPYQFEFHRKPSVRIAVDLLQFERAAPPSPSNPERR